MCTNNVTCHKKIFCVCQQQPLCPSKAIRLLFNLQSTDENDFNKAYQRDLCYLRDKKQQLLISWFN